MNEHMVVKAIKCESISESSPYISIKAIVNTIVGMPDSMINAFPITASIANIEMQSEARAGANIKRIAIAGINCITDFNDGSVNAIPTEIIMIGGTAFPAMSETCRTNSGNSICRYFNDKPMITA